MSRSRTRDERGASTIELVLYMPLLMIAALLTVQFALVYLGNVAVANTAREAARETRITGDPDAGRETALRTAEGLGRGTVRDVDVDVQIVDGQNARVTVSGHAPAILPFLDTWRVSETIEGPLERFVVDD